MLSNRTSVLGSGLVEARVGEVVGHVLDVERDVAEDQLAVARVESLDRVDQFEARRGLAHDGQLRRSRVSRGRNHLPARGSLARLEVGIEGQRSELAVLRGRAGLGAVGSSSGGGSGEESDGLHAE